MIYKIKHLLYYNQLQLLFILNYMEEKLVMAEELCRNVDFIAIT